MKERKLTQPAQPAAGIHQEFDAAVAGRYGWPADLSDDEILARLFELNQARAGPSAAAAA